MKRRHNAEFATPRNIRRNAPPADQHRQRAGAKASISAKGSFWAPSRTRPLEPNQIAPDFSTTGNNAAARPPSWFVGFSARNAV